MLHNPDLKIRACGRIILARSFCTRQPLEKPPAIIARSLMKDLPTQLRRGLIYQPGISNIDARLIS